MAKIEPFTQKSDSQYPTREEAEKAVEVLLRYIGEEPQREGLRETPARYVRAFEEFFEGYKQDPRGVLQKTFEDIENYDDMVLVRNIDFVSHCEHHIAAIIGTAHVAYWPDQRVVGISKLARVVDICAKRLTSQENMTTQITDAINDVLAPKGVAVLIEANHQCMSTRGAGKAHSSTVTTTFTGIFDTDRDVRERFLGLTRL